MVSFGSGKSLSFARESSACSILRVRAVYRESHVFDCTGLSNSQPSIRAVEGPADGVAMLRTLSCMQKASSRACMFGSGCQECQSAKALGYRLMLQEPILHCPTCFAVCEVCKIQRAIKLVAGKTTHACKFRCRHSGWSVNDWTTSWIRTAYGHNGHKTSSCYACYQCRP